MSHFNRSHVPHATTETVSGFPRPNTFSEPTFEEPFNAASAFHADFAWSSEDSPPAAGMSVESFGHDFLLG